jgi:hypothetical protein
VICVDITVHRGQLAKKGRGETDDCWRWFPIALIPERTSFNCQPTYAAPRLLAAQCDLILMTLLSTGIGVYYLQLFL